MEGDEVNTNEETYDNPIPIPQYHIGKTEKKPTSFLDDGEGNASSGRLIKVMAFILSCVVTITGLTIAGFLLFTPKPIDTTSMLMDGTTFVSLILGLVGLLSSIALGAEITQKITKQ